MHLHHYSNESSNSEQFSENIIPQWIKKIQYEEEGPEDMHLHPYSNESSNSEQFSESIILQEINKIQNEEEIQEMYDEESMFTKWFFTMNRENGGVVRFECMGIRVPLSLDITYLVWILTFVIPVIGFCLIIPALRKKAGASFIVVLMFSSTGLALITGLLTTSWLVGEVEGKMTIGPLNTRCNTRVGIWVGLTTINITLEKSQVYLNERISIYDHDMLKANQKQAMIAGWPWPILLILEYLTGEGKHWSGSLGFYLNRAGRMVSVVLYFSAFLWIVWMFCFTIAAHLACKPLILSGILELMSAVVYAVQIYIYIVPYVILEGNTLNFSFGWSWWFTLFLGCLHICCGMILLLYDHFRPGKLSTIFEVDFGLPTHRLNIKKINHKFGDECSLDTTNGFDSDDFESSTYESFHQPNPLQPSPMQPNPDQPIPVPPSPDLSEIRQQGIVAGNICYTPKACTPKACTPRACTPNAFTPNAFAPKACTPKVFTPNTFTPNAFTPNAFTPNAYTLNAYTPNACTPNAYTPNACTPNAADISSKGLLQGPDNTPNAYTSNACTLNAYTPNACTPDAADISSKGLLQGLDIPKDKVKNVKRNILFQQNHSTPHKIFVH